MSESIKKLDTSRVLNISITIFSQNFWMFFDLALLITSPIMFYSLFVTSMGSGLPDFNERLTYDVVAYGISNLIVWALLAGAMTYGVLSSMRGKPISFKKCFEQGAFLFVPVLGATVVSLFISLFFTMLLIIPGLICMVMFYVVVPVIIEEKLPIWDSLIRSRELTSGYRWQVVSVWLLMGIVPAVIYGILVDFIVIGQLHIMESNSVPGIIVSYLYQSLISVFSIIVTTVVYRELRQIKEIV